MNTYMNKIHGSLMGFAIGDAMGATTEFMHTSEIQHVYGGVADIIGGGWLNLRAGEVTDDTQMMMCVARAMMKHYPDIENTLNETCKNFVEWYDSNPKDIGNSCRRAIETNRGKPSWGDWMITNKAYQETHMFDHGNGGLMRCLVPCLIGDERLARLQAELTHTNTLSSQSVKTYFNAVQIALTDNFENFDFGMFKVKMAPTGYVKNTLTNALYFSQMNSFEEAIVAAVNDGGDADTIAALTGGIAGARFGYDNIPKRWKNQLDSKVNRELLDVSEFICDHLKKQEVANEEA